MNKTLLGILSFLCVFNLHAQDPKVWEKHEINFTSDKEYDNPIYDIKEFRVTFTSPSGRILNLNGFWNGGKDWKVRICPDEVGAWLWASTCSDTANMGLNKQTGNFSCVLNESNIELYERGAIIHNKGLYQLSYSNGTPFFWLACTAWNGALKSNDEDWDFYLSQRKRNNYSVIQLVATEWRGCDKNAEGLTAIEGAAYIRINPEFFKRIDNKIDEANAKGLVVSPVILWAYYTSTGRHLNPGYALPMEEAVLLAKYIVARYQGNHVVWTLGGDGKYYDEQEVKWKEIGSRVFNKIDHAPVTLHPHGGSWVGDLFDQEEWYTLMGYQSSHNKSESRVNWINKGPMSQMWDKLKPMPYINMEPNYEEHRHRITAKDVRNASYWSIFTTPLAGVTYGAIGIYPWLEPGEQILNHRNIGRITGWRKSIEFPGSIQMGYLAGFIKKLEWWNLYPANEILAEQPGEKIYNHWISVVKSADDKTIVAYIPENAKVKFFNPKGYEYSAKWFNPVENSYTDVELVHKGNIISFSQEFENDMVIVLKKK